MKALQFDRTGDLDALKVTELPTPRPAGGEVLVQIQAAGLNPSDVKNVLGRFPYTTLPRIPGRDFAGVVVEGPPALVGKSVWGTGKEPGFVRDGSHAGFIALPATGVAAKPESLSFVQAASCGVPYTTAWDALQSTRLQPGEKAMVVGANGAVGRAALALARWRGADVIGAVRAPEHLQALEALGIPGVLLGDPDALKKSVERYFPGGANMIFDTTGFWLPGCISALAPFGRLAVIAAPADGHVQVPVLDLYRRGGVIVGINSLLHDTTACTAMLESIRPGFDSGALPAPGHILEWPLNSGADAYARVNAGSAEKIVLVP